MIPIKLPRISKPPRLQKRLIGYARELDLGMIDSITIEPGQHPGWKEYITYLACHGWRPRGCARYSPNTLTYVNGSSPWHEDPGFGKVAACLLYRVRDLYVTTQLITKHGGCDMNVGDVVVFDSDYGHAWIGHGPSVFAIMTVAPIRKRRQVEP